MKGIVINLNSRPDRWELFQKNKFPFEVVRYSGVIGICGEDGCTRSHLNVLQSMRDRDSYPFVVFEDDCVMLQSWEVVENVMQQLPLDWDALWLGANPKHRLIRYSENLYRLSDAWCLHAVIYNSRRMIDYILQNHNTPSHQNLDIFICKQVQKRFNCFITYPIMATQLNDQGDIASINYGNYYEIINNYNKCVVE